MIPSTGSCIRLGTVKPFSADFPRRQLMNTYTPTEITQIEGLYPLIKSVYVLRKENGNVIVLGTNHGFFIEEIYGFEIDAATGLSRPRYGQKVFMGSFPKAFEAEIDQLLGENAKELNTQIGSVRVFKETVPDLERRLRVRVKEVVTNDHLGFLQRQDMDNLRLAAYALGANGLAQYSEAGDRYTENHTGIPVLITDMNI